MANVVYRSAVLAGALVLLANWPRTFIVMMPINKRLMATPGDHASSETRTLLQKWYYLHGVRTLLGFLSAVAFLLGIAS
jgi:hypothetical protein